MNKPITGLFSELTKEEPLSTLEPDLTASDSCVLESVSPFFGYYHDGPMAQPEPHVYCVLDGYYSVIEVARAANRINGSRNYPFDAAVGNISMGKESCHVMRIKHISHYNEVAGIQYDFMNAGIGFKPRQRKIDSRMTVVRLLKFIYLYPGEDGVFMDAGNPGMGYFILPAYVGWEEFKPLTEEVKNDTSILYFDAARISSYDKGGIQEMVRIYKEHLTPEMLRAIRDRYHKIIG